jgi:CyaY protein
MHTPLDERTYQTLASSELQQLVNALDELAAEREEFEVELASDILTVEFKDGSRFVINSHRAARQIWMAAGTAAWHFDYKGGAWASSKSAEPLWHVLEEQLSRKLSRPLSLATRPA